MTRILLLGLLWVAAAGAQPYAQSVKETDRAERTSVSGQCSANLVAATTASCAAYTVPAGKRLVLQQVSLFCEFTTQSTAGLVSAELRTQLTGQPEMATPLLHESLVLLSAPLKTYSADDPVRLYADAGTAVTVHFQRTEGAAATASCSARFHGTLRPL